MAQFILYIILEGNIMDNKRRSILKIVPEGNKKRIQFNSGGDRQGRHDDSDEQVQRKIDLFHRRTILLLEHYRAKNIPVHIFPVKVQTGSHEIHRWLETKKDIF